jgi:hypothetical protein
MDPEALLNLLAEQRWIEVEDAERLLHEYEEQSADLFDFLEASGVGAKVDILGVAAEARGTEFVDLDKVEFPPKLFDSVPVDVVRIYRCVPIHDSKELLKVCLADPLDDAAAEELAAVLGRSIKVVVADPLLVEELVESKIRGTLSSAPSVGAIKTAPVAASMGTAEVLQEDTGPTGAPSYAWLYVWALLAFAAAGTSAVYLHQRGTLAAANELIAEFDTLQEQRDLENLALERRAYELEQKLEKFDTELDRSSADAIRIAQLETELRRLEGRLQTLLEILPEDANLRAPASDTQTPAD